jgi:hypothetical protein
MAQPADLLGLWKGNVECPPHGHWKMLWNITSVMAGTYAGTGEIERPPKKWDLTATVDGDKVSIYQFVGLTISGNTITGRWYTMGQTCDVTMKR